MEIKRLKGKYIFPPGLIFSWGVDGNGFLSLGGGGCFIYLWDSNFRLARIPVPLFWNVKGEEGDGRRGVF